ncbi:uncharacterized protein LOC117488196 [Trematomus bernacchii]|uniref:uncharacterized protein LOC117488196 n=1 Tax=Trematomus bernacchii TaxID=40690 RepID=UPI00146B0887|nr:uncharacterized protein LOC117488196 [Trematomus bernacchii]
MEAGRNRRGCLLSVVQKEHLKLDDLRDRAQGLENNYVFKNDRIPEYPRPEIHVSHLKHDTDRKGLIGIKLFRGFRNPWREDLVWWGLSVGREELRSAEQRLLQETYPDRTEQQVQDQQSFLGKFASSLAFKKISRLGSYRFTFPLQELLEAYSRQFCGGEQPLMRVYETHLYKQEVMYVVLVHSPANQEQFSEYPLLTDDPNAVCCYRDGRFIWRPEAMCETHRFELFRNDETQLMEARPCSPHQVYVWDNVGLALHVEDKLLEFDPLRLREKLKFCKGEKLIHVPVEFDDFPLAEATVRRFWPEDPSPLERDEEQDVNKAVINQSLDKHIL